jgi:hypothetical protein
VVSNLHNQNYTAVLPKGPRERNELFIALLFSLNLEDLLLDDLNLFVDLDLFDPLLGLFLILSFDFLFVFSLLVFLTILTFQFTFSVAIGIRYHIGL